jgi:nucleotidyltransferase substrate binding protein (TIGR01987 family)
MKEKISLFEKDKSPHITSFIELGKAITKLQEAIQATNIPPEFKIDVVIQRFEFVYELFWKTIQKIVQKEGIEVASPRAALKTAFSLKLIENQELWLQMLEDSNLTSHTYKEALANEIASRIEQYLPEIKRAYQVIKKDYFTKTV